ncbi:MAG: hypothetical protein HZA06_07200 [Nitrospirae bacterium]|nr:hypothetical protein [Nitrospirota bacterium]
MKRYLILMILLLPLLVFGCGEETASSGSSITISPSTVTVNDTGSQAWHRQYFTIKVTDSSGNPLGNIKIKISFPWAYPDSSDLVRLYDGDNLQNSPFEATTDEYGSYILRFDFRSGGLTYSGNLTVQSGSAYGYAEFKVTASSS